MIADGKVSQSFPDSAIVRDLVKKTAFAARVICPVIWPEIDMTDWIRKSETLDASREKLSSIGVDNRDKISVGISKANFIWSIFEIRLCRVQSVNHWQFDAVSFLDILADVAAGLSAQTVPDAGDFGDHRVHASEKRLHVLDQAADRAANNLSVRSCLSVLNSPRSFAPIDSEDVCIFLLQDQS